MQLPAVYLSDEKGYLSPVGRNPRRSMDMPYSINSPSHLKPLSMDIASEGGVRGGDTGVRGGDTGVRGGDVELAGRATGSSLGKEEGAKVAKRIGSHDRKTPRRPSHGSGDSVTIAVSSNSIDFSGLKRSMMFSNAAFLETSNHPEEKKAAPKLGKPTCSSMACVTRLHMSATTACSCLSEDSL